MTTQTAEKMDESKPTTATSPTSDSSNVGSGGIAIISADPPTWPITAAKLAATRTRCMAMRVAGVADVEGFKIADRARMDIKQDRCAVQNRAKELKQQIKRWQDENVDAPAKSLIDELAKIETYLESQTEPIKLEKERLAVEAKQKIERERLAKLDARVAALVVCGAVQHVPAVEKLTDQQFAELLTRSQHEFKLRLEQAESDRIKREADAAELAELRKVLAAANQKRDEQIKHAALLANAESHTIPPATNAMPSRPATAIPMPVTPAPQPVSQVEATVATDTNRQRDLRRLSEFADYIASLKVPDVGADMTALVSAINEILYGTVAEIREQIDAVKQLAGLASELTNADEFADM